MVTNDPETMHSKITSHEKHHIYTDDDGVEKKKCFRLRQLTATHLLAITCFMFIRWSGSVRNNPRIKSLAARW